MNGFIRLILSLVLSLSGCVANHTGLSGNRKLAPDLYPIVVGYFSHSKNLGYFCPPSEPPLEVDCFGLPPTTQLTVTELLIGTIPEKRLELYAYDLHHPERFPNGSDQLQLIRLNNQFDAEGKIHGDLEDFWPLARLKSGELAIPVGTDEDLPSLPCVDDEDFNIEPLKFAYPYPSQAPNEYLAKLGLRNRENPRVEFAGNKVIIKYGVRLASIRKIIERMPTDSKYETCWNKD